MCAKYFWDTDSLLRSDGHSLCKEESSMWIFLILNQVEAAVYTGKNSWERSSRVEFEYLYLVNTSYFR
jgi:hypothetical protein